MLDGSSQNNTLKTCLLVMRVEKAIQLLNSSRFSLTEVTDFKGNCVAAFVTFLPCYLFTNPHLTSKSTENCLPSKHLQSQCKLLPIYPINYDSYVDLYENRVRLERIFTS